MQASYSAMVATSRTSMSNMRGSLGELICLHVREHWGKFEHDVEAARLAVLDAQLAAQQIDVMTRYRQGEIEVGRRLLLGQVEHANAAWIDQRLAVVLESDYKAARGFFRRRFDGGAFRISAGHKIEKAFNNLPQHSPIGDDHRQVRRRRPTQFGLLRLARQRAARL